MIYINFVELHCLMLHAKFQNHRPSGSGEENLLKVFAIYSHGGHLGHVTWTIYIYFCLPFLRMLLMKFGFDWPKVSEEKIFEIVDDGRTPNGHPISSPFKSLAQVS